MIKKYIFILVFCLVFIIPITVSNAFIKLDYENYKDKINKTRTEIIIKKIIQCESEGKEDIWGDKNYKFPAYGIAQMQKRTFYWLMGISGKKNMKWKNKDHQIELLEWALQNGQGNLWTCYRILSKKGEI